MTLKELLDRCDFKDVAQALVNLYIDRNNVIPFKEAFDILRHLEPEENPSNLMELRLVGEYDESSQTYHFVHISRWYETLEWKYELTSKIIVDDGLTLSDAEIAAHCLWELTYTGFDQSTPEKWDEAQYSILGDFGQRLLGKEPNAKEIIDCTNPYVVAAETLKNDLELTDLDENEENEAWREIKKLRRMARVEEDIRRLTSDTKSFKREELEYLFKTKLITFSNCRTFAFNSSQRIDYLIDLLSNYDMTDYSPNTHFLLMFRTSSAYPLVQRELDMLQEFFSQYLPASANIRYGYGTDEELDMEVSLFLLGSY